MLKIKLQDIIITPNSKLGLYLVKSIWFLSNKFQPNEQY